MSLYKMMKPNPDPLDQIKWIAAGKSTNLFYATKRCIENGWRLVEVETGRHLISGYEPPELVPHEDRSVRQLRRDPKWVASQIWVNA